MDWPGIRRETQRIQALNYPPPANPTARTSADHGAVRVFRGQQLLAVEDRIGAGEETQRLHFVAHILAPRRQAHIECGMVMRATAMVRTNSKGSSGSALGQRRALDLHQQIDRHTLGVLRQIGQLLQQRRRDRA